VSGGRQVGLFWGAAALSALILSPLASGAAAGLPPCFFHRVTGFPCLTCGGTRAALALLSGDLAGALSLAGRGLREPERLPGWARPAALLGLAANWLWLIVDGR